MRNERWASNRRLEEGLTTISSRKMVAGLRGASLEEASEVTEVGSETASVVNLVEAVSEGILEVIIAGEDSVGVEAAIEEARVTGESVTTNSAKRTTLDNN